MGPYDLAVGAGDTASQGVIGADQLGLRALQRPADVLEAIPGMVVTQHSGDGKANQYFLRGMNLDHGTDFATTVNGVPVNLPSHAHGQGYSDLNFLIPELVRKVDYRKGPYFASEGDFSSAGSANFVYRTRLDQPFADLTVGQRGHARALVAGSTPAGEEATLLMAVERVNNNGPWTVPDGFRKANAQFILSGGSPREGWTASLSSYAAHWRSTDQVPQRLIDAGTYQGQPFGRFDSLDPSDGARTRRTSLSGSGHLASDDELTQWSWYVLQYDFRLFSNFTYSLERASDQFAQTDSRTVLGAKASRSWFSQLSAEQSLRNTVGVQLRQDRIRAGLYDSTEGQIQATVRDDSVRQTLAGVHAESEMGWTPWLRTVAGLRGDQFSARVVSHAQADNSGQSSAFLLSPKFSLVLGPWQQTAFFFNAGRGFHSNDARGTTARVDPRTGQPVDAVAALVGSRGRELGLKSQPHADWQTSLAFWQLDLDSELVYVGDAGSTVAGRPSRRTGVEWRTQWTPGRHFSMDLGLAWTRPRYTDGDPAGPYVANAMQKVAHLALSLRQLGPWSGSLGIRYLGAAPLTEDNAVRSSAVATANLRVQRKVSSDLDLGLDVLNLGNRKYNDIGYVYASRLTGEPTGGVEDLHVHPGQPRTVRVTARIRF